MQPEHQTGTTQNLYKTDESLYQAGITVVVVTHESAVARHSRRVIWFRDGKVIHSNLNPQELHSVID